jgi:hypothetical protein
MPILKGICKNRNEDVCTQVYKEEFEEAPAHIHKERDHSDENDERCNEQKPSDQREPAEYAKNDCPKQANRVHDRNYKHLVGRELPWDAMN